MKRVIAGARKHLNNNYNQYVMKIFSRPILGRYFYLCQNLPHLLRRRVQIFANLSTISEPDSDLIFEPISIDKLMDKN